MDLPFTNLDSEPELWYACAGPLVHIPPANSLVYYFIQGHIEHCCSNEDNRAIVNCLLAKSLRPRILCRVISVNYLADPATDQVFAKFRLQPLLDHPPIKPDDSLYPNIGPPDQIKRYPESAVRECLDRITNLPPLTPYYSVRYDLHSVPKLFECIRSKGRVDKVHVGRSWFELLNRNRVAEGDTILLTKDRAGEERYGILRRKRRRYKGYGLDTDTITNAVAAKFNLPFDVYYYPRVNTPEFVVEAGRVEAAMRSPWQVGARFSMLYEDERTSEVQTCKGSISSVEGVDHDNWPDSEWRMLQIIKDDPQLNLKKTLVNPWMLELKYEEESSRNSNAINVNSSVSIVLQK